MLSNELIAVVNTKGNVDVKYINGSRTPMRTINCEGKAVSVPQLLQENGRIVEVYVQCNDGIIRVYDSAGSCFKRR